MAHIGLFEKLINNITITLGYKPGVNLRGAPYDFRKFGDSCYTTELFSKLKQLVEVTASQNDGRSVRFICHSLGCVVG